MLKHVSFLTHHPEAVVEFYARLGGRPVKDVVSGDGLRRLVVQFEGGGKLQFFAVPEPVAPTSSWMEHVALELPDLHASIAELRALGVTFTRDLHLSPGGNPVAFVADPDGRQVELLQQGL
ncbi:VOC family protein [Deinococcus pimensis]|uniref:VOC family protein n=1 Tax=Deinococcus pimensis TaxID=309888 RepID=UPI000480B354|nr:VOC family protein [Deinococcus pimensis]